MKDSTCFIVFSWIVQILVWISLILTIYFFVADISAKLTFLIIFIASYIAYFALEFCSNVFRYISAKTTESGICQKMGSYYRAYPVFKFYCECYHYELRKRRVRSKKGRSRTVTKRVRVTTHRETYNFPYYSERDVSGLFYLDCDTALVNRKYFIQLDIYDEINFADAISYMDYEAAKDRFWRRNRFRDKNFYFNESRYIPGLVKENLVTISNNEPCCINACAYFFYVLITFAEFYKIYFHSLCLSQTYRIRKIVSTRYDLNQPVYEDFIPQVDIISQQYNFQAADYNYLNNDYQLNIPTKEELEKAKVYQNKVPDYKISSGGGKIHAGVVLDDPGYSSYNLNKPPEAFTSIAGDVALKNNQVNANGELPPGFGTSQFKFNVANNDDSDSDDDQPGQGYGTNLAQINNNNINKGNNQPKQVKISTERAILKENKINTQQNNQQYSQMYPQQSQAQNYQYQQYPEQYPQQYPEQYPQQYPEQYPQQYQIYPQQY